MCMRMYVHVVGNVFMGLYRIVLTSTHAGSRAASIPILRWYKTTRWIWEGRGGFFPRFSSLYRAIGLCANTHTHTYTYTYLVAEGRTAKGISGEWIFIVERRAPSFHNALTPPLGARFNSPFFWFSVWLLLKELKKKGKGLCLRTMDYIPRWE